MQIKKGSRPKMWRKLPDSRAEEKRRILSRLWLSRGFFGHFAQNSYSKRLTLLLHSVRCFKDLARLRLAGPLSCIFSVSMGASRKKLGFPPEYCYHSPLENGLMVPFCSRKVS